MLNNDELNAMGINETQNKEQYSSNKVATTIKVISFLEVIGGIILSISAYSDLKYIFRDEIATVTGWTIFFICLISAIFIYAIAEIIQKLHNIDNNTKYIAYKNNIDDDIPNL